MSEALRPVLAVMTQHLSRIDSFDTDFLRSSIISQSVVTDIDLLRANPFFPSEFHVAGLVYDVDTGEVHTVVPLQPLREH